MLSRRLLFPLLGACLLAGLEPLRAQEAWTHYRNGRYGTSVDYQEFFEADPPPVNDDGQSFTSPEAKFSVYARLNRGGETPKSYLADLLADADYAKTTYRNIAGNRLTISGYRGGNTFYEVYLFSPRGVVHALVLAYPTQHQNDYDAMVTRMARSFTGP